MRLFLIVLLSFFAVYTEAGALCETGRANCPSGFKCVANVGCVPQNKTCRCPQQACEWPMKCDCKGGCKLRECGPTRSCGRSVNPTNACETSICRQGKCVAAPLACDNCDRIAGCPTNGDGLVTRDFEAGVEEQDETFSAEHWGDDDDDDHDHHWDHHDPPTKNKNLVIGMGILIGLVAVIGGGYLLFA